MKEMTDGGGACILRHRRTEEEKARRHIHGDTGAKFSSWQLKPSDDGCSNTITTVTKDNMLMEADKKRKGWFWSEEKKKWCRYRIRKLTPREYFRLMDVSEPDIDKIQSSGVSESQQYKLAGNSIVVNVMYCIFKNLFIGSDEVKDTLF